jgi:hypothetical protein
MDELQLIRQFRADLPVATEARERAQEALRARITGRRRRRKLVLAVAFAVVALLATGVALGLADDVIDLVRGKPAPKDVQQLSFRSLDKLPPGANWPQADASRARGVSAVRVEGGLFTLWEAPVPGGGWCFATWVLDDEALQLLAPGGMGACDHKPPPQGRLLAFPGLGFTGFFNDPAGRHWVGSVFGIAPRDVATVRIRFPSGRTIQVKTLPSFVSEARYFLVAVPRGADDLEARGLDEEGRVVAKTPDGTRLSFD